MILPHKSLHFLLTWDNQQENKCTFMLGDIHYCSQYPTKKLFEN